MFQSLFLVFIGGGLGSIFRYLISLYTNNPSSGFPLKTFIANVLSCIVLGFLMGYLVKNNLDDKTKLLLMTGFCGGFSTFSTFSAEVFTLIDNAQMMTAIFYVLASVILCTVLLFGAYLVAQSI